MSIAEFRLDIRFSNSPLAASKYLLTIVPILVILITRQLVDDDSSTRYRGGER